jgi:hypothetical protein
VRCRSYEQRTVVVAVAVAVAGGDHLGREEESRGGGGCERERGCSGDTLLTIIAQKRMTSLRCIRWRVVVGDDGSMRREEGHQAMHLLLEQEETTTRE